MPDVTPSVDVRTWLIVEPEPAAAPVTFVDESIVQLKLVPETPLGLVITTFVLEPEHMV